MGIRGMSIGSIAIVLLIVLLLFGTKRLKNIGEDLGGALKGFLGTFRGEEEPAAKSKTDKVE